jgi:ubiquinone/menaquinone biosynthesis C-methylase UbiE
MMSSVQRVTARYDLIRDFYIQAVGMDVVVSDLTAATLLDLLGDVRGTRVLDIACGRV